MRTNLTAGFLFACVLSLAAPFVAAQNTPPADTLSIDSASPPNDCIARVIPYSEWRPPREPSSSLIIYAPNGGSLFYFGAAHSDDPEDPQFAQIRAAFQDFEPTVIFYEGPERPLAETADETIRLYGESGYVRYLADSSGVEIARLEPNPSAEMQYVLQQFTAEQAMLFYVLREASRLRERKEMGEGAIKEEISQLLERAGTLMEESPIATIEDLEAAYKRHWTEPEDWWMAPSGWFDPVPDSSSTGGQFTNNVNRVSSHFRNMHMSRVLTEAVLRGERVFAVVGRNHVPMQEPAIKCALEAI